jgi:uncharacterized sporulation protein YeaH/YhbH (DUF444 family)
VLTLNTAPGTTEPRSPERSAALAIYDLDVSASMTDTQKEFARRVHTLLGMWLELKYSRVPAARYVVHDAQAQQVNEHVFFQTRQPGGTKISSAYQLCAKLLDELPDTDKHDVYIVQFSDGDNW